MTIRAKLSSDDLPIRVICQQEEIIVMQLL